MTATAAPAAEAIAPAPTPTQPAPAFDPTAGIINIGGRGKDAKEYLPVNWRVLWLRNEHPGASIVTEAIQMTADAAIFRATVTLEDGTTATGHGSQSKSQFPSFLEKAETKAIGRALAALGYGTLAAFEEGSDVADKADAPVGRNGQNGQAAPAEVDWPALWAYVKARGITDRAGLDHAARRSTADMSPAQIKALIDGVDRLVKMTDDKLVALVLDAQRPEGLRVGAANEYCRRADTPQALAGRLLGIAEGIPEAALNRLMTEHKQRLGAGQSPRSVPAPEAPIEQVVGPPANAPAPAEPEAEKGTLPAKEGQLLALESLARLRGFSQATVLEMARATYPNVQTLKQLNRLQATALIDDVRRQPVVETAEAPA